LVLFVHKKNGLLALFITLEGGEGAGKSTAARGLAEALRARGREVVLTREPGGTPGAEAIRALLLNPATQLVAQADILLHFAARADHVERLIKPALGRGAVVVCDRFYDSTMAYQAYGQLANAETVRVLIGLLGLKPDVTFILDIPEDIAKSRLAGRGLAVDRYDAMGSAFMRRVADGFRAIAAAEPARCRVIDASGTPDDVLADILVHIP
jgi:dTMP kinase